MSRNYGLPKYLCIIIAIWLLCITTVHSHPYVHGDSAAVFRVGDDADGDIAFEVNTLLDEVRVRAGYELYISDEAWFYDRLVGWDGFILDALDLAANEYIIDARDAGTSRFFVDKEGDVFVRGDIEADSATSGYYLNDGQYIDGWLSSSRRIMRFGGSGGAKNTSLRMDFDLTDNRVSLLDGVQMEHDFQFSDEERNLFFGTGADVSFHYETDGTNHGLVIGTTVGAAEASGHLMLVEEADKDNANRRPPDASANPVWDVWSADATAAADRIYMFHDQTDGWLASGAGNLKFYDTVTGAKTLAELVGVGASVDLASEVTGTLPLANMLSGVSVYLNDQETAVALTADGTGKTYSLAANSYAFIQMKAWGYLNGAANTASTWNLYFRDATVQKGNTMVAAVPATGAGDIHGIPFYLETIFAETTAQTLDLYCDETVDGGTLNVQGFQVWGIK